ncbi:hypothetical protein AMECASPLE_031599, partial [Ameca splendens]
SKTGLTQQGNQTHHTDCLRCQISRFGQGDQNTALETPDSKASKVYAVIRVCLLQGDSLTTSPCGCFVQISHKSQHISDENTANFPFSCIQLSSWPSFRLSRGLIILQEEWHVVKMRNKPIGLIPQSYLTSKLDHMPLIF